MLHWCNIFKEFPNPENPDSDNYSLGIMVKPTINCALAARRARRPRPYELPSLKGKVSP